MLNRATRLVFCKDFLFPANSERQQQIRLSRRPREIGGRFQTLREFALPNQRMMPAAESATLPVDTVDPRGEDFGALSPERLCQFRHVVANDHGFFVQDQAVAAKLLLGILG